MFHKKSLPPYLAQTAYEVTQSVKEKHGLGPLSEEELFTYLTNNNIKLITKDDISKIDMNTAGTGIIANKLIFPGECIVYGLGGQIVTPSEVEHFSDSEKKHANSTGVIINLQHLNYNTLYFTYEREEQLVNEVEAKNYLKEKFKLITYPQQCSMVCLMNNSITGSYKLYFVKYEPTNLLFESFVELDIKHQFPKLFKLCSEFPYQPGVVQKKLVEEDLLRQDILALIPPQGDTADIGQYLQHAKESDSLYSRVSSHQGPNFILELVKIKEHVIPLLMATKLITPGTLLCWDYLNSAHLNADNNLSIKVWNSRGEDINTLALLHYQSISRRTHISSQLTKIMHLSTPNLQIEYGLYLALLFSHYEVLFTLSPEEISSLLNLTNRFNLHQTNPNWESIQRFCQFTLEKISTWQHRSFLPNNSLVKTMPQTLLDSPDTAAHWLINNQPILTATMENPLLNRDCFYIPYNDIDLNESERRDQSTRYWKQFGTLAEKGLAYYQRNQIDLAIQAWQLALNFAKNSIEACQIKNSREKVCLFSSILYWDKNGGIARAYINLAKAYEKLNKKDEQLYCLEQCIRYINAGYGAFYKDTQSIHNSYRAIAETYAVEDLDSRITASP